jgi:hypothetical protein
LYASLREVEIRNYVTKSLYASSIIIRVINSREMGMISSTRGETKMNTNIYSEILKETMRKSQ